MTIMTADICDEHGSEVQVADAVFERYGQAACFSGPVQTLRVFEDNALVRDLLATEGRGRVLVIDGGGSRRCALLGGNLAQRALDNGWVGVIVHGCIRDRHEIDALPLGVLALQTMPLKSGKTGRGETDAEVRFAGVTVRSGAWVYADADGLLVAARALHGGAAAAS